MITQFRYTNRRQQKSMFTFWGRKHRVMNESKTKINKQRVAHANDETV